MDTMVIVLGFHRGHRFIVFFVLSRRLVPLTS